MCVFVLGAYLKQQRSFEGDLVVVSGEFWQCRGNGVGWRTSSSSLIEGKGMECLISPTLLREHVPPLQDTHACRYVHVYGLKNTYTHTILWKMCKFVKTEIRLFSQVSLKASCIVLCFYFSQKCILNFVIGLCCYETLMSLLKLIVTFPKPFRWPAWPKKGADP